MAEVLILAIDVSGCPHDPEKERRGGHQRGDVIDIYPDGTATQSRETRRPRSMGGRFRIIIVPGTVAEVQASFRKRYNIAANEPLTKPGHPTIRRKRLRVNVPDGDGFLRMTIDELHASVTDKARERETQ